MTAPIEIPLRNARTMLNLLVATAFALVAGAGLIIGELTGVHSTAGRVFGIGFGVVLLAIGAVFGLAGVTVVQARSLVVDTGGLRWQTARRGGWSVRWSELATVAVHVGQTVGRQGWRRRVFVHLVMTTEDAGFRARHHEFDGLRGTYSDSGPKRVGIPFADRPDLVTPIDDALRTFAGTRYRGVVDDGRLARPGYRPGPGDDRPAW